MKPRIANKEYLGWLLEPLSGYGEERELSEYEFGHIDEETDTGLRQLVKEALIPHFLTFDARNKEIIRNILCKAFHDPNTDFKRIWDSQFTPFELDNQRARKFFNYMWEEFFPGESLQDCHPKEVVSLDYLMAGRKTGAEGEHLEGLLIPFEGGAQNSNDPHRSTPPEEGPVKAVFRERLVPYFASLPAAEQARLKQAFQKALASEWTVWAYIWKSHFPPFDCPQNARDLFVWMWQVLFPGEPPPQMK